MSNTLYVANLSPDTSADDLGALFSEHGEIDQLDLVTDEHTQLPVALVDMAAEKQATRAMNNLNGSILAGHRLAITPLEIDYNKELTAKQRKSVQQVVEDLQETEKVPLRQIESMIRFCGTQYVQALLDETDEIEADEGMMTSDNARRRTRGGVFFYLARYRMSPALRRLIYNRKGKVPGEQYD
jgi:RNA recognition motif-containing protein